MIRRPPTGVKAFRGSPALAWSALLSITPSGDYFIHAEADLSADSVVWQHLPLPFRVQPPDAPLGDRQEPRHGRHINKGFRFVFHFLISKSRSANSASSGSSPVSGAFADFPISPYLGRAISKSLRHCGQTRSPGQLLQNIRSQPRNMHSRSFSSLRLRICLILVPFLAAFFPALLKLHEENPITDSSVSAIPPVTSTWRAWVSVLAVFPPAIIATNPWVHPVPSAVMAARMRTSPRFLSHGFCPPSALPKSSRPRLVFITRCPPKAPNLSSISHTFFAIHFHRIRATLSLQRLCKISHRPAKSEKTPRKRDRRRGRPVPKMTLP